MKMPRIYTFDVPDFDDCGGRTMRRVEVPKAVFCQIEADVAASLHATIHQLGENAAKAAGEYAEEVGRLREALHLCASRLQVASVDAMQAGDTRLSVQCITWANDATRAALTEPSDG